MKESWKDIPGYDIATPDDKSLIRCHSDYVAELIESNKKIIKIVISDMERILDNKEPNEYEKEKQGTYLVN